MPPRSKLEAPLTLSFLSTNVAVVLNTEVTAEVNLLEGRMAKTASADTRKFSRNRTLAFSGLHYCFSDTTEAEKPDSAAAARNWQLLATAAKGRGIFIMSAALVSTREIIQSAHTRADIRQPHRQ